MNLKFSEPKNLNVNGMKKIFIKTTDENPVRIITKTCYSFGVKRDERYDSKSMSIVLDDDSVEKFKKII